MCEIWNRNPPTVDGGVRAALDGVLAMRRDDSVCPSRSVGHPMSDVR